MDRYDSTEVKVVRQGDEYFLVEEGSNFNPQPRLVKKLVTESVDYTVLAKRGDDYFKSRFEAGDYEVTLGTGDKDNWIRPKRGSASIRLDWVEMQKFIRAHEEKPTFAQGGLVYTTPNITVKTSGISQTADEINAEIRRVYGK
jgi:hypothetical protein